MLAMWGKALRTIPRLSGDEWNALDIVSRWLVATRAAVLVMTSTSAMIAGVWAWHDGQFNWLLWVCLLVGLTMAHATNNLLNDLIDYRAGVDHNNYFRAQYGPQPLVHGLLDQRGLLLYVAVTGLIALIPGAYLVWLRGELALYLLLAGAVFVVFYTWPLKYIGMGAPATPIKAPETTQAISLMRRVGTPEHSAASSESRTARRPRPKKEFWM